MVEAPTIGAKIVPSRDYRHLIDGSLSVIAAVSGGWAATAALGHYRTIVETLRARKLIERLGAPQSTTCLREF
jgi:hypothetical protein